MLIYKITPIKNEKHFKLFYRRFDLFRHYINKGTFKRVNIYHNAINRITANVN